MWKEKIFSNGDVTSGKLQDFIAKEYLDENGNVDYKEACRHYEKCIGRLEFMIRFIKQNLPNKKISE
jgi:hypothetical protein